MRLMTAAATANFLLARRVPQAALSSRTHVKNIPPNAR
jgi:hypothetical protein